MGVAKNAKASSFFLCIKVLEETAIDLETSNQRCLQLGSELKAKIQEVEKLRIFKFMARQADIREDSLRAKLEDIKQELAISRKTELTFESKYKKLKTKYESLCLSFEKLKLDQQEMGMTKDHQLDLVWLRESNEKLRKDVLKLTSALLVPNSADDLHMTNNSSNNYNKNLIELIKELASANNKLKADLLDCSDMLMECRDDLYAKLEQQQHQNDEVMHNDDTIRCYKKDDAYQGDDDNIWLSTSAPQSNEESIKNVPRLLRRTESKRSNLLEHDDETGAIVTQQDDLGITNSTSTNNVPQSFISLPIDAPPTVVHHHYHYYMKKRLMAEKGIHIENELASGSSDSALALEKDDKKGTASLASPPTIRLSTSDSGISKDVDSTSPFHQLYNQVTIVLQRLQQTDIRALNRRLRRAFDIFELSSMSNSIIENIVTDVDDLRTRFLWIEDCHAIAKQEPWVHDISMLEFFPLMELVQEMLKEIGQLRTTMNDLQVEYVKKVEESDTKLEEELLRKQQEQQQQIQQQQQQMHQKQKQSSKTDEHANRVTLGSWLSSVFQRKNTVVPDQPTSTHQQRKPQFTSNQFILNNNSSDISVTTTGSSIHPLCIPANKSTNFLVPSSSSNTGNSATEKSSMVAIIRRKKSDIDRFGPPSSFPTRSPPVPIGNEKSKRRSTTQISSSSNVPLSSSTSNMNTTIIHNKPITLRASQSAGTVRRSKSMQAPALEYVVRRKRSMLGMNASSSTDYDLLISPQTTSSDMTGAFATSWLGNK